MVSQFKGNEFIRQLGEVDFTFPEGIHAIGRLDSLSEGLLILTTNKKVTKLLLQSKTLHKRTYLVLVQNKVSSATLQQLRNGVSFIIKNNTMYTTTPCEVDIIEDPQLHFNSPYIMNSYIEYTWLKITLTEGKYRQIRKMVATVHHRCVRLVRVSIENLTLNNIPAGGIQEIKEEDFFTKLKIVNWK
jgi:23S rRNA pseudouridine2457 synthase